MDCAAFEDRLDRVLAGTCSEGEWAAAETHLAGCARCRRLFEAVRTEMPPLGPGEGEALTRSILARTTGAACGRVRELACDLVDGTLPGIDREMVAAHVEGCRDCGALVATLSDLSRVLPAMASIDPPADFVRSVLWATTERPMAPSFGVRIGQWWSRAIERPRFSLEVAYVLTVLLILLVGNPVAAFRDASARAMAVAQTPVSRTVDRVAEPIVSARSNGEATLEAAEGTLASIEARLQAIGRSLDNALRGSASAQPRGQPSVFGTLLDSILRAGSDVWRFWQGLLARRPPDESGHRPASGR
jgi:anti-sigma factor RsiW